MRAGFSAVPWMDCMGRGWAGRSRRGWEMAGRGLGVGCEESGRDMLEESTGRYGGLRYGAHTPGQRMQKDPGLGDSPRVRTEKIRVGGWSDHGRGATAQALRRGSLDNVDAGAGARRAAVRRGGGIVAAGAAINRPGRGFRRSGCGDQYRTGMNTPGCRPSPPCTKPSSL